MGWVPSILLDQIGVDFEVGPTIFLFARGLDAAHFISLLEI